MSKTVLGPREVFYLDEQGQQQPIRMWAEIGTRDEDGFSLGNLRVDSQLFEWNSPELIAEDDLTLIVRMMMVGEVAISSWCESCGVVPYRYEAGDSQEPGSLLGAKMPATVDAMMREGAKSD